MRDMYTQQDAKFGSWLLDRGYGLMICALLLIQTISLLFTGDVLLDRGVRPVAESKGMEWLFAGVSEQFKSADAVIINLECPLTDVSTPLNKRYIFRADTRWAKDLRKVGVTHAALANNHTNDQNYQGLESTKQALESADIVPLGLMNRENGESDHLTIPSFIKKGNITVALYNAVLFPLENWTNSKSRLTPVQSNAFTLAKSISEYKKKHPDHRVIAILHWGTEFQTRPSRKQQLDSRMLISAGADAIIGHHPHVIQPTQCIDGHPVCFSLGNFVFDQKDPETRKAQMAKIDISSDTIICTTIDITIKENRPIIDKR